MTATASREEERLSEPTPDIGGFESGGTDPGEALSCLNTFSASLAPDGSEAFSGALALNSPENLGSEDVGVILARLAALASWTQAQQARVVHRMETLIADEVEASLRRTDDALAMSLTAAEAGAVLNMPHMSAMQLVSESAQLCTAQSATLAALSHGRISHRHARAVLDQLQGIPRRQASGFEIDLLSAAEGRTCAQFIRTARRLREARWPETMPARHRSAIDGRRVSFDPAADGMGEFCAHIAAEKGQAIFTALTLAAQGERKAGDPRTLDQLRADIFTSLMLHSNRHPKTTASSGPESGHPAPPEAPEAPVSASASVSAPVPADASASASASASVSASVSGTGSTSTDEDRSAQSAFVSESGWDAAGIRAEIMVLISADTLFGFDENPAELNGVGPITAKSARRLAEQALHWTGLVQDPSTGEILAVGRRRKVPAGLKRWLQARDGTCRFPGCGVGTPRAEIDHTIPWARGGLTEHGNLANLCPKHHRYKTLGFWSARQPEPGILEWVSPLGRVYRTVPQLQLDYGPGSSTRFGFVPGSSPVPADADPPPF